MVSSRAAALLLSLAVTTVTCGQAKTPSPLQIEHLRAFATLYGHVRFFHPSDEAAATDWDRFAMLGAERVSRLASRTQLRTELEALFHPIAPAIQFLGTGEKLGPMPEEAAVVAWQHLGVGLGGETPYRSSRLNRATAPGSIGSIVNGVDATPHRGKKLRLRAHGRAEVSGHANQLQFWVRVDRAERKLGFFHNMDDRPVTSARWAAYEILGDIADDAQLIVFGAFLRGEGKAWVDEFMLEVREPDGTWHNVPIGNAGFEESDTGELPKGWSGNPSGYQISTQRDDVAVGKQALRIESLPRTVMPALFEARPRNGEYSDVALAPDLRAIIPLTLADRDGKTQPVADAKSLRKLREALAKLNPNATANDRAVRLAGVIIAWNVLHHFYPYWDVVKADWDAMLTAALVRAYPDQTAEQYRDLLSEFVAALEDGHGAVVHPRLMVDRGFLPVVAELVEGQPVVVGVPPNSPFKVGDVIVSIDQVPVMDEVSSLMALRSGSPQWKRATVPRQLGAGPKDSKARVVVERERAQVTIETVRGELAEASPPLVASFSEVRPGIVYVDLSAVDMLDIESAMPKLTTARGIVFDLRGYPKDNHDVLRHLSGTSLQSARFQIARRIYPDQKRLVGYDESGRWNLEPLEPRLAARVVFLTGGGAISYAESVMGIVEHYRLGTIVGGATAGANGNINAIPLPGGFHIAYTGMRVVKHDGSQHHLVGIQPDIAVERTVAGVRAGKDEVLERGIAVIDGSP
ncbi:MAG TPA: S41 family peptidase [Thermoanaerobaculia bacterium]